MKDPRGPWYLLTGLALGLLFGLLVAWVVSPTRYSDTSPQYLDQASKSEYRLLIASAYAADIDLRRAQARLALLRDPDPAQALAAQAQQITLDGGSLGEAQALAFLSAALGAQPSHTPTPLPPQP